MLLGAGSGPLPAATGTMPCHTISPCQAHTGDDVCVEGAIEWRAERKLIVLLSDEMSVFRSIGEPPPPPVTWGSCWYDEGEADRDADGDEKLGGTLTKLSGHESGDDERLDEVVPGSAKPDCIREKAGSDEMGGSSGTCAGEDDERGRGGESDDSGGRIGGGCWC